MTRPGTYYFYLSYAQVPPLEFPGETLAPEDRLVDLFFEDLSQRVADLASARDARIGHYQSTVAVGTEWKDALHALGHAQVLVPLYSPRYLASAWAVEEHYSFEKRLRAANADPERHIQSVLWLPFPGGAGHPPLTNGLRFRDEEIPYYMELGLAALCDAGRIDQPARVPEFRDSYDRFVDQLAHRIVNTAENTPIRSAVLTGDPPEAVADPADAHLLIAVHAPGRGDPEEWEPYAESPGTAIARQALLVARRLDLSAAVVTLPGAADLWHGKPTILLIDVWSLSDRDAAAALESALRAMPHWVIPLIIVDGADRANASRVVELRARALAMLSRGGHAPVTPVAEDAGGFREILPALVARARNRFLHELPRAYPGRPRLGMTEPRRVPWKGED
ncbi:hypothetical protein [Actinoplanes sp. NPDC051851]|uniref:hypothetical protein n=1 Tax=Actinoplanes sp. NPDC051851 TaxID=3154753 RepID=UPI00341BE94F